MRALVFAACLFALVAVPAAVAAVAAVAADAGVDASASSCVWVVDYPDLGLAVCASKTGPCSVEVVTVDKQGTTRACVV